MVPPPSPEMSCRPGEMMDLALYTMYMPTWGMTGGSGVASVTGSVGARAGVGAGP